MLSDTFFDEMLQNLGQNNTPENFQQPLKFACRKTDFPLKKFMNRFAEWYAVGDCVAKFWCIWPPNFAQVQKFLIKKFKTTHRKFSTNIEIRFPKISET